MKNRVLILFVLLMGQSLIAKPHAIDGSINPLTITPFPATNGGSLISISCTPCVWTQSSVRFEYEYKRYAVLSNGNVNVSTQTFCAILDEFEANRNGCYHEYEEAKRACEADRALRGCGF